MKNSLGRALMHTRESESPRMENKTELRSYKNK